MDFITLFLIALGLSADAFAAAFGLGLCSDKKDIPLRAIGCGGVFGLFQAIMPLFGYLLVSVVGEKIQRYDHWIAFILLAYIGISMIFESAKEIKAQNKGRPACPAKDNWSIKNLLILGIATSIDAFAAGISLAMLKANIYYAVALIGAVTFFVSASGMYLGKRLGGPLKSYAGIAGGSVLVGIGLKTLLQHLFLKG